MVIMVPLRRSENHLLLFIVLLFLAASLVYAQSPGGADKAARDAARRLEEFFNGSNSGTGTNQSVVSAQMTRGGPEPAWINDPYRVYNRNRYITAVGYAANRSEAEKKALGELAAIFGRSVQAEESLVSVYSEAVSQGIISVSENVRIRDMSVIAASMDRLIGAEIGYVWDSGQGIVYAAAFMDKEKAVAIYTDLIHINNQNIEWLTAMNAGEKNTFNGYARYTLAARIAAINEKYFNVIVQAGGSKASLNLTSADYCNIEASNILKNINVFLSVKNDRDNRIQDTFAKVFSAEGLRTRGNNPPYTLEVTVNLSEAVFPNSQNKFCSYVISANLNENVSGAVLLPFNFSGRVAHLSYERAADMAIVAAERTINEQYPAIFREYLAALLPRK